MVICQYLILLEIVYLTFQLKIRGTICTTCTPISLSLYSYCSYSYLYVLVCQFYILYIYLYILNVVVYTDYLYLYLQKYSNFGHHTWVLNCHAFNIYERRAYTVIDYNSTNINKTNNHRSPQIIEHKKTTTCDVGYWCPSLKQAY